MPVNLDVTDMAKTYDTVYSAFTNAGYVRDNESITGWSHDAFNIKDLVTTPDLVRFIPTVIQTVVREALEPALLIIPNCFQTLNIPKGRIVQIGSVGAMIASPIAEAGEYPTQDLDVDGGSYMLPRNAVMY